MHHLDAEDGGDATPLVSGPLGGPSGLAFAPLLGKRLIGRDIRDDSFPRREPPPSRAGTAVFSGMREQAAKSNAASERCGVFLTRS